MTLFSPTPGRGEAGFSLVEVLIALIILIFGLTTIAAFSKTNGQANRLAREQNDAVHLAQSRLEQLRHFRDRAGYDAIQPGSTSATTASTQYTLTWQVTTQTTPPYKVVRMQTTWVDSVGTHRMVELATLMAWFDPMQ